MNYKIIWKLSHCESILCGRRDSACSVCVVTGELAAVTAPSSASIKITENNKSCFYTLYKDALAVFYFILNATLMYSYQILFRSHRTLKKSSLLALSKHGLSLSIYITAYRIQALTHHMFWILRCR